ncbi:MAG: DUF177 domain-containing protein [Candidatus Eisenbacteria bacterium]
MDAIRIELSGIREGVNRFDFRVGPEEIELEEEGAVFRKPVDLAIEVARTAGTLTVRGTIRTEVERICGRCLTAYREALEVPFAEALKIEGEKVRVFDVEYEGDPGFLPGPPGSLVLDEIVREEILVTTPMQPVCRPDCGGLCPVCGADRNKGDCGCRMEEGHPAWEPLRKLSQDLGKRE